MKVRYGQGMRQSRTGGIVRDSGMPESLRLLRRTRGRYMGRNAGFSGDRLPEGGRCAANP